MGDAPVEPGSSAGSTPLSQAAESAAVEAETPERAKRRDQVATTLIGATATVAALLALLGASSDRIWVILDDSTAKKGLFATALLAVIAIALGLWALLADNPRTATRRLLGGTVSFVAALTAAVWTASSGANQFARPSFTQITLERVLTDATNLRFTVHTESLDASQRIGVRVVDDEERILFDATLVPNAVGVANQEVSLALRGAVDSLLIAAWHRDRSSTGSEAPICDVSPPPDGTACVFVNL